MLETRQVYGLSKPKSTHLVNLDKVGIPADDRLKLLVRVLLHVVLDHRVVLPCVQRTGYCAVVQVRARDRGGEGAGEWRRLKL